MKVDVSCDGAPPDLVEPLIHGYSGADTCNSMKMKDSRLPNAVHKLLCPLCPAHSTTRAEKFAKAPVTHAVSKLVRWPSIQEAVNVNQARCNGGSTLWLRG